jgi:hypothetical protein
MMVVEMGNQMKDLHTLLHYLPIIGKPVHLQANTSLGDCIDVIVISAQLAF